MTHTFNLIEEIEKFARLQREYKERTLAEIIEKYDFVVGSIERKHKLMEVLPEGANIICSPYIESPTMIYAISRQAVLEVIRKCHCEEWVKAKVGAPIEALLSVTSQPKTGCWIASDISNEKYVCSECGGACWYYDHEGDVAKSRYCPNCGAKMVEPQESEG